MHRNGGGGGVGGNAATPLNVQRYINVPGMNGGVPPSPMTPLDMSYGQSMLPSNLFVSTPYFTPPPSAQYFPPISHHSSLRNSQVSLANSHGSYSRSRNRGHQHRNNSSQHHQEHHPEHPQHQYQHQNVHEHGQDAAQKITNGTSTHNPTSQINGSAPVSEHNLEHLNLSRTVILRNIADDMTLHDLLDHIDFGPIEYVKLFTKTPPRSLDNNGSNDIKSNKNCTISFINSKTSVMFYLKYAKNSSNLNKLRLSLRSQHLKITLCDMNKPQYANAPPKQDYIKLKNLNYIIDHKATRCLKISFSIKDVLLDDTTADARLTHLKHYISTQCEKFGDVESFEIELDIPGKDEEGDVAGDDSKMTLLGAATVHFTSIDASVKTYEDYNKRIVHDSEKRRGGAGCDGEVDTITKKKRDSSNDLYDVNSKYGIHFILAIFHNDRCDKTLVEYRHELEDNQPPPTEGNGRLMKKSFTENGSCGLIAEEGPLGNSSEVGSIIDSPEQQPPPADVHIIDPVSPNSSDIENASPIICDTYALSSGDPCNEHEAHAQASIASNGVYSMISSDARQLNATPQFVHIPFTTDSPFGLHSNSSFVSNYNPDPINTGNRAIHLGNLHPHTTIEEIANNLRAGGLVESINHFPERRMCFVTFVDANIAFKFFMNHQVLHQLVIHGTDVSVGWAKKHSGPVLREIALAVTAGASRNVYLGLRNGQVEDETTRKPIIPSEDELRLDFSRIGGLEQINFYHNKECAFLNFLNISDAIKVVHAFECEEPIAVINLTKLLRGDQAAATALYQKYKLFKVNFGKDRCGNPPKFSFRKNFDKSLGSTYHQYQDQLHACVGKSKKGKKSGNNKQVNDRDDDLKREQLDQREGVIDDEAAKVFGIIKESEKNTVESVGDDDKHKELLQDSGVIDEEARVEVADSPDADVTQAPKMGQHKVTEIKEHSNGDAGQSPVVVDVAEENEEGEEEYEDDDDDEDVSIIIGSDDTVSTNASGKYDSFNDTFGYKAHRLEDRRQKVYHQPYYHDHASWNGRGSRNSSAMSINNGVMMHPYAQYASPQFNHHPSLMSHTSSTSSFQAYQPSPKSRNGSFHHHQTHSAGPYQQQMYAIPQLPQLVGQFAPPPHVRYVPVIQGQQVMPTAMPTQMPPGSMGNGMCGSSGSQVMAQYLAQAQQGAAPAMCTGPVYAVPHASYNYHGPRNKLKNRKGTDEQ